MTITLVIEKAKASKKERINTSLDFEFLLFLSNKIQTIINP